MPGSRQASARLLDGLFVAGARLDRAWRQNRERARLFANGLAVHALDAVELEALTIRLYESAPASYAGERLADWEEAMVQRALPSPPASVLVTAAGSGREARALLARGYSVDALEPAPSMAAACAAVPGIGSVWAASHDDLVAAVEQGLGPAAPAAGRLYDAVLVGWGSFTHILREERQRSLLAACGRLAPSGPILLSFFADMGTPRRPTRAFAAGARLGRRLGARRGIDAAQPAIGFSWHLGFTCAFTVAQIERLAADVGRIADVTMTPYGHAVLSPAPGA